MPVESQLGADHPLAAAAGRAAGAARDRAHDLASRRTPGVAHSVGVAAAVEAVCCLEAADRRLHEAQRRLLTLRLARAHAAVLGQDTMVAARRLARLTLDESVRGTPLDD